MRYVGRLIVVSFVFFFGHIMRIKTLFYQGRFDVGQRRDFNCFAVCFIIVVFIVGVDGSFFRGFSVNIGNEVVLFFRYFFRFFRSLVEASRFGNDRRDFYRADDLMNREDNGNCHVVGFFRCVRMNYVIFFFNGLYGAYFLFYFYARRVVVGGNFVRSGQVFPMVK